MPNVVFQVVEVAGTAEDIKAFATDVRTRDTSEYSFGFDAYQIAEDLKVAETFRQMSGFLAMGGFSGYLDNTQISELINQYKNDWKEEDFGDFIKISTILFIGYCQLPAEIFDAIAAKHPNVSIASHWDQEFGSFFGCALWLHGKQIVWNEFEGPLKIDAVHCFLNKEEID